jgi:hypothetical protein
VSFILHSRSGVGDLRLLMASRTSSWLIRLILRPIFPIRETTSQFTLFFDSLVGKVSGIFSSIFLDGGEDFSILISSFVMSAGGVGAIG